MCIGYINVNGWGPADMIHELHESKIPFVSLMKFIRSYFLCICRCVRGVAGDGRRPSGVSSADLCAVLQSGSTGHGRPVRSHRPPASAAGSPGRAASERPGRGGTLGWQPAHTYGPLRELPRGLLTRWHDAEILNDGSWLPERCQLLLLTKPMSMPGLLVFWVGLLSWCDVHAWSSDGLPSWCDEYAGLLMATQLVWRVCWSSDGYPAGVTSMLVFWWLPSWCDEYAGLRMGYPAGAPNCRASNLVGRRPAAASSPSPPSPRLARHPKPLQLRQLSRWHAAEPACSDGRPSVVFCRPGSFTRRLCGRSTGAGFPTRRTVKWSTRVAMDAVTGYLHRGRAASVSRSHPACMPVQVQWRSRS